MSVRATQEELWRERLRLLWVKSMEKLLKADIYLFLLRRVPRLRQSASTFGLHHIIAPITDALHPDAARNSRKRTRDYPGDEHEVRERSASRHEEFEKNGLWRSAYLQRKDRETRMIEEGKRVERPFRQRGNKDFCMNARSSDPFMICRVRSADMRDALNIGLQSNIEGYVF